MKHIFSIILILGLSTLISCDTPVDDPVPYAYVNIQLSLLDPNSSIPNDKGYRYLTGVGAKGILLYRESSTSYLAFERNCTYQAKNGCVVEVDSSQLFIKCKCCKSQFKFDGTPFAGPAFRPLTRYSTYIGGNTLYINN